MLIRLRQQGPSGISPPLTDVRHLTGIKHKQQADFSSEQLEEHEINILASLMGLLMWVPQLLALCIGYIQLNMFIYCIDF